MTDFIALLLYICFYTIAAFFAIASIVIIISWSFSFMYLWFIVFFIWIIYASIRSMFKKE